MDKTTPWPGSQAMWVALCKKGFALQMTMVVMIATSAYLGWIPTAIGFLPHFDLVGHFGLIGMTAFFLDGALAYRKVHPAVPWLRQAPLYVFTVAGIEEAAQALSPRRSSCFSDLFADLLGIVVLTAVSKYWFERLAR
jgi:polysaccharide biosynthesis protein VpsQ